MNCEHATVSCDDGERVCTACGTILGSLVDEGAEWRVYANTEDDPSRTGGIIKAGSSLLTFAGQSYDRTRT